MRIDSCFMMDGDVDSNNYDSRKDPECAPYLGRKGQTWKTSVRDFGSAVSMREVSDDSLEDSFGACMASTLAGTNG